MIRVRVKLTQWSMGMREAVVAAVFVSVGDEVKSGDQLIEAEAEKVSDMLVAPAAGKIVQINVAPGDVVQVGSEILVMETEGL
jgi:pyruvate/2-oxoglutarate dehydrogenase complex dihydrolipoamide acyltransferase (E2) component